MREESAQLKDGLKEVLERLADKQIEASARHQEQLGQHLSSSLREPLQSIVESLQSYGKVQNEQVSHALQDQMTSFADSGNAATAFPIFSTFWSSLPKAGLPRAPASSASAARSR